MWKLIKCIGWLIKALFWIVILLGVAVGVCLYILEQGVPDTYVQRLAEKLSTDDLVCRIERMTFSLRDGLTVHHVKFFKKRTITEPLFSLDELHAEFTIFSREPINQRLKRLTLRSFEFPLLPPRTKPRGAKPDPFPEITLPPIPPFELVLENPNILGIRVQKLTANVSAEGNLIAVSNLKGVWPDKPTELTLAGGTTIDLRAKRLTGGVAGQVYPTHVTPLLSQLRGARGAVKQIECFQELARPLRVSYNVDLDLDVLDYAMFLDIDGGACTYRGVPVQFFKSTINITDTNNLVIVDIHINEGATHTGALKGRLVYTDDTDALEIDAETTVSKDELLAIINVLNHGELNAIRCDSGLRVAAKGVVTVNSKNPLTTNDLHVALSFDKGSVLRIPLAKTSTDLHLDHFSAKCNNIQAEIANGGKATGTFIAEFPDYVATNTTFVTQLQADKADLANILCIANPTNTYPGKLTGKIQLNGPLSGDILSALNGEGRFELTDGIFARIPLFSGLTEWLANNIPGIGSLVNQSSGSLSFTMTNGVATTQDMVVEGSIFSISGKGSLTLPTDKLDISVKVNIFKEKTFMGSISRVVAFPFTRMLLDFHLGGSTKAPKWSYVTLLEKITDSLTPQEAPPTPEK
jgi:AsmA-like C-terminal region